MGVTEGLFESEITKLQKRLDKIDHNPSSTMLRSNRLLYGAQLENNKALLQWWKDGKPFVALAGAGIETLFRAFGDYQILPMVYIADRLGTKKAEEAMDKLRAMGLPDYACDRTMLFMPFASAGVELPKPKVIITRTGGCNVVNNSFRTMGRLLNVPVHTLEVPFSDPYQEHLDYVVEQLRDLIGWVEKNLPGAKYDENALVELQQVNRRWYAAMHDICELRKQAPCPDHPRDVFREPVYPAMFVRPMAMVEYYEAYRDELRDRVRRGFVPVGEEKLRLVWGITGPYGSGIWDYLAGRGVSVPWWHFGGAGRRFFKPGYEDDAEFGRKLSPLEEVGRMMLYNSWGGDGERWIRDTVFVCKEFKADGIVQFEQTGCQPIMGVGQIIKERIEKELGIPCWNVEGRMLLGRTERTEAEFMEGLESFVNLCFERKKGR